MLRSALLVLLALSAPALAQPARLPSPQEMAASRTDAWGEAALRHPDGPSYEFFKGLLPPLRYVNTAFKHYPIVLCAPGHPVKARFVSNGSGINLRADKPPMWREVGTPVAFFVGDKAEAFGSNVERLTGPNYLLDGLPVVIVVYSDDRANYLQQAFAPVRGPLAEHGAVFVHFRIFQGGRVVARLGAKEKFTAANGLVRDAKGHGVVHYGPGWEWNEDKAELAAQAGRLQTAELVVFTKPVEQAPKEFPSFDGEFKACAEHWKELIARGARLEVPEEIVQDA